MSARTGFLVLAIASAGEGVPGVPSCRSRLTVADDGLLNSREAVRALREWCHQSGHEVYGTMELSGQVGTKKDVIQTINRPSPSPSPSLSISLYHSGCDRIDSGYHGATSLAQTLVIYSYTIFITNLEPLCTLFPYLACRLLY